jgi:hypothetical protein
MSHEIQGGESPGIRKAADVAANLAIDIRYRENESRHHLHNRDLTHDEVRQEALHMLHHHRSAEYGAKIVLSALTSMKIIDEDFEVERFAHEVERIRQEMGFEERTASAL